MPAEQVAGPVLPQQLAATLTGHDGAVLTVRFNQKGTYCLSCGKDRTIRLWNPHKGFCIKAYTGHGYQVRDVSVSQDNSQMASVGGDKQVFLWDVASGNVIRKFRGHEAKINAVAHAANDEVLVTGGYDAAVKVWDCRSRSIDPVQTMTHFKDDVTSVISTAHAIIAGSVDNTIRRFDIRMGRVYTDELHHSVSALAVTQDNLCVLAACLDSCLRLLDVQAGELLAAYKGHHHESVRMGCGFLADDQHVVGCSEDGTVCYWELVDANLVSSFKAHNGVVCGVATHPMEPCLLTCSVDGTIKVWR